MSPNKKQFYIVDDDESVGRALGLLLRTFGFDAQAFICGEDFIYTVPNTTPGCLILDVHMPGLNGWETQQRLVASGSTRPVIFISADEGSSLMKQSYRAGAVGYLQKPFKDQELADLIQLVY